MSHKPLSAVLSPGAAQLLTRHLGHIRNREPLHTVPAATQGLRNLVGQEKQPLGILVEGSGKAVQSAYGESLH